MKIKLDKKGLTLIELMIAIAIIGIISVYVAINAKPSYALRLRDTTEQFAGDFRAVRNMVISRQVYKFTGDTQANYPDGGYCIFFNRGNINTPGSHKYTIFAVKSAPSSPDTTCGGDSSVKEAIKTVVIPTDVNLWSTNGTGNMDLYVQMVSENEVKHNLTAPAPTEPQIYSIDLGNLACTGQCPRARVVVAKRVDQDLSSYMTPIGVTYRTDVIAVNPPASCFLAGTKILMADGNQKNIEDIEIGDLITSAEPGLKTVTVRAIESPVRDGYYSVYLANGKLLKVTDEHPLYARNDFAEDWASFDPALTYQDAQMDVLDMKDMKQLQTVDGWVDIVKVSYKAEKVKTYNLSEVDGNTFYADGVKVHNKKKPSGGGSFPL